MSLQPPGKGSFLSRVGRRLSVSPSRSSRSENSRSENSRSEKGQYGGNPEFGGGEPPPPPYAPGGSDGFSGGSSGPPPPPSGNPFEQPSNNPFEPPPGPLQRTATFRNIPAEDPYARLATFDTVFLIDDSGSMCGANWKQTADALAAIVPVCTVHDSDGVDIHFLNTSQRPMHCGITSAGQVLEVFSSVRPMGATPTGRRLELILNTYLAGFREARLRGDGLKPLNIICITDGSPTDPDKLERTLINTAKELDRLQAPAEQVGIQFFQVGNDMRATDSLEELDNALAEEAGVRDIVDTVSWRKMNAGQGLSADGILKVVLGGVDRRLDQKRRV